MQEHTLKAPHFPDLSPFIKLPFSFFNRDSETQSGQKHNIHIVPPQRNVNLHENREAGEAIETCPSCLSTYAAFPGSNAGKDCRVTSIMIPRASSLSFHTEVSQSTSL